MGWQSGGGNGTGDEPLPEPAAPSGRPGAVSAPGALGGPASPSGTARDERLAGFARGGVWDACPPGPELAAVVASVAGAESRCPGAEPDELIGVMRRAAALESWAAAVKLGVIRELIRHDDLPALGRPRHGDLPDAWSDSLNHQLALALACSVPSAEKTALAAWELGARLPGIAALLADGTLTYGKAKLVAEIFQLLSDVDAARAEALIAPQLSGTTGKTYGQVISLASRAAAEVDPGLAERRRKAAVKHTSRVQMFREQSGAAALCGRDLPPDETLAANANVNARAMQYKASGAFPGARMDQLRSAAYLDLINSRTAEDRIALGYLSTDPDPEAAPDTAMAAANRGGTGNSDGEPDDGDPGGTPPSGGDGPDRSGPGNADDPGDGHCAGTEPPSEKDSSHGGPGDRGNPNDRPGGRRPSSGDGPDRSGPGDGGCGASGQVPPAFRGQSGIRPVLTDLVVPLATLLGLAERPGEGHGLGVLDPDLCRDLAGLAAASPHTQLCVTVTGPGGIAIGHGCGRPPKPDSAPPGQLSAHASPPSVVLPARVNLTITAGRLSAMLSGTPGLLGRPGPPGKPSQRAAARWTLTRRAAGGPPGPAGGTGSASEPGVSNRSSRTARQGPHDVTGSPADPAWCGTWLLTLPGGGEVAVGIEPVPTHGCDHRHESHGYQPNDVLRHLVQVRDCVCTFPSCSRHARESDFEHARPYDRGGRTCSCNAGARSRKCHRVKQSPGWNVTQPRPGWHLWATPNGRTYTQAPYQYPV